MRFSNAYAPAPTCTPSRKSIQFGKTPGRLQYTFVHDVLANKRNLKWVDEVSMADVLKGQRQGTMSLRTLVRAWLRASG
jgi:arylsulfatase A-like enzyme